MLTYKNCPRASVCYRGTTYPYEELVLELSTFQFAPSNLYLTNQVTEHHLHVRLIMLAMEVQEIEVSFEIVEQLQNDVKLLFRSNVLRGVCSHYHTDQFSFLGSLY